MNKEFLSGATRSIYIDKYRSLLITKSHSYFLRNFYEANIGLFRKLTLQWRRNLLLRVIFRRYSVVPVVTRADGVKDDTSLERTYKQGWSFDVDERQSWLLASVLWFQRPTKYQRASPRRPQRRSDVLCYSNLLASSVFLLLLLSCNTPSSNDWETEGTVTEEIRLWMGLCKFIRLTSLLQADEDSYAPSPLRPRIFASLWGFVTPK